MVRFVLFLLLTLHVTVFVAEAQKVEPVFSKRVSVGVSHHLCLRAEVPEATDESGIFNRQPVCPSRKSRDACTEFL